jgi:hypothetical protein
LDLLTTYRSLSTIKYNSVTDFHTTKHSTLLASVYLHSRIYNTGTITVSLNHTLPIPLRYSTHKVLKSHVKSSQADFFYSSVLLDLTACLLVRVLLPLLLTRICSEPSWTLIYIAAERTCITGNTCHVITTYCCVMSPRTRKTQLSLLLRVGPCLHSCFLETRFSNPL